MTSTLLFVAALVVATAAIVWGRFRTVRIPRGTFRWPKPPVVWVHPGVDIVTVARATAVWEGLGHAIGPVKLGDGSAGGIHFVPDDGTLIALSASGWHAMAAATQLDTSIPRADVLVATDRPLDIPTALHELAHAYDYHHPTLWPPKGHVMNPDGGRRGMDTRGLEGP